MSLVKLFIGAVIFSVSTLTFAQRIAVDNADTIAIGGKIADQYTSIVPIRLVANEESKATNIGAILKPGQRALFELEVTYRDSWNNKNQPTCSVRPLGTNSNLFTVGFHLINISTTSEAKYSSSTLKTTGTYNWGVFTQNNQGTLVSYDVYCSGYQYGYAPSLVVKVRRTIYE